MIIDETCVIVFATYFYVYVLFYLSFLSLIVFLPIHFMVYSIATNSNLFKFSLHLILIYFFIISFLVETRMINYRKYYVNGRRKNFDQIKYL